MKAYLLSQINRELVWVQAAAHGAAWFGYDGNDMNAADSVKQIVRMHVEKDLDYSIELWQRGRQSEYTFHGVVYNWVLQELNSIIRQVT